MEDCITLDISLPENEFDELVEFKRFNLIYPIKHPVAVGSKMGIVIRLLGYYDQEYFELIRGDKKSSEVEAFGIINYEIIYLREVSIKNVTKNEWGLNYGPKNASEFCKLSKLKPYDHVKVVAISIPRYSLKELGVEK